MTYGIHAFLPMTFQVLNLTPEFWQEEILPNKTILMIGGPHRGGTTVTWKCIREHPDISHFGDTKDTATELSEGVFMQDVYPQWGLGVEPLDPGKMHGQPPYKKFKGGLGQYALQNEAKVHLKEDNELVNPTAQARLLNRFGYFWNLTKPVLLEKSPTNAVISRFLQALLNLEVPNGYDATKKSGISPVRFVFITRHPLANALAHRAWHFCRSMPLSRLIENWLAVNRYNREDTPHLQFVKSIRLEEFQANPDKYLSEIFEWVGLEPSKNNRTVVVRNNTNLKYKKRYCKWCDTHTGGHERLVQKFEPRVNKFGYSIKKWGDWCDERT
eukprot:CAMPEP_0167758748 /NCGR_PEP_ID=MMETSP0110_2-20121227/10638_1 /TAXON_ID=629695 /ORGANISM="Gymnochlora sp., Strain CCMP2014" /LENGTH=327 /DNA_ID=CAMNT_0007645053 /DNA_START=145 /DNA_END=1128 /DNA_ORIENTATION=+